MPDREWFTVERPNGTPVANDAGQTSLPNKEAAVELARAEAPNFNAPLTVVKYIRKEIRTVQRNVSIVEADIGAV